MGNDGGRPRAAQPGDLSRFFLERANAGDVEGLVELYEPGAVVAFPAGQVSTGHEEIRQAYRKLLSEVSAFSAVPQPVLQNGDLALTSARLPDGGATAEIARRQPDGTWLWAIDQPRVRG